MANIHFFQPLLPGFHNHLTIPVAFFLKHIKRRYEQKTVELRTDASKIIWKVKIDGRRLTNGWKEFALSHDLRIGDILIFRKERNLTFHVTLFGPSCCEIQYRSCDNLGIIQKKKKVKKNPRREAESCFVANVTAANLRYDSLNLPVSFVRKNGIVTGSGKIVLMNENGRRSWTLKLRQKPSCGIIYIRSGWRSFCDANGLKAGNILTFKLSKRGGTLVLRFSSKELEEEEEEEEEEYFETNEIESLSTEPESDGESSQEKRISQEFTKRKGKKGRLIGKASSSPSQNRFVTVPLTPYNTRTSTLVLPMPFTKLNGIHNAKKVSLLDKHGVKWSTNIWFEKRSKRMSLGGGWKEFCEANGVKIGESIMLKLIWGADKSSVLKYCSKVTPQFI